MFWEASPQEMEDFKRRMDLWCYHHPAACQKCTNFSECQTPNECERSKPNKSPATWTKLSQQIIDKETPDDKAKGKPKAKTIGDWYQNYKNNTNYRFTKTIPVKKLLAFLEMFEENPHLDDKLLQTYIIELDTLYGKHLLTEGLKRSEEIIKIYRYQEEIIRRWALFHNRKMRWWDVRNELTQVRTEIKNDKVVAECNLAVFESYLNDFAANYSQELFKELVKGKCGYLDAVPNKENNSKYYYFLARYYEEEWWWLTINNKPKPLSLHYGIEAINKSIEIFEEKRSRSISYTPKRSDYSNSDPWWLYGHKALLLKLWEHEDFPSALAKYEGMILKELERANEKDNEILKRSFQMYAATYQLLKDDSQLEALLNLLNRKIDIAISSLPEEAREEVRKAEVSEVDNFTFHHTDFIFHKQSDKKKKKKYCSILENWFKKKSH